MRSREVVSAEEGWFNGKEREVGRKAVGCRGLVGVEGVVGGGRRNTKCA